jgi:cysteine protease ATG4
MRSERPISSVSDNHLSYYQSSHSTSRLSNIPTRLSGWFQHAFNSSATDLSLPHLINTIPPPSSSPKGKSSAVLTAAKHGKGHLDKAVISSTAIPPPTSAPTQFGSWACSTPAMNPHPPRLRHRHSHAVVRSTQGGQPPFGPRHPRQ